MSPHDRTHGAGPDQNGAERNGADQPLVETGLDDHLQRLARAGYVFAAALFTGGLYLDWQSPGLVVVPPLSFTGDPYGNSGLFVLAVAIGLVCYAIDRTASRYAGRDRNEVDRTQEYTVDVDSEY